MVGGHWSSGVPYLNSALKRSWVPRPPGSTSLEGVQLMLLRANVSALKVSGLSQRLSHLPGKPCSTRHGQQLPSIMRITWCCSSGTPLKNCAVKHAGVQAGTSERTAARGSRLQRTTLKEPWMRSQAAVLAEGDALWDPAQQAQRSAVLRGRGGNAARYKPGSQEALLVFSDRDGGRTFRFPAYRRLRAALDPVLEQVGDPPACVRALNSRSIGAVPLPDVSRGPSRCHCTSCCRILSDRLTQHLRMNFQMVPSSTQLWRDV